MAFEPAELRALLNLSVVPVLAFSSFYFIARKPRGPAPWFLAAFLALLACRMLAAGLVDVVGGDTVAGLAWAEVANDENYIAFCAFFAFGWFFPTRLTASSAHGRLYLAICVAFGFGILTTSLARPLVGTFSGTLGFVLNQCTVFPTYVALGSMLWRARPLAMRERRATALVAVGCVLSPWTAGGGRIVRVLEGSTIGWSDAYYAYAIAIAIALMLLWRSWLALILLAYGATVAASKTVVGLDFSSFAIALALRAIVPVYAAGRSSVFPLGPASRRLSRGVALAVFTAWFLMFNVVVIVVTGGQPIALAFGVILGLAFGIIGALSILPREDPLAAFASDRSRGASAAAGGDAAAGDSGLLMSRYRFLRHIGEGGQGRAELHRDERLSRDVVVKRIGGGNAEDAVREARTLARLQHAGVVAVYDSAVVNGEGIVVMEYAAGGSLARKLAARGKLPQEEAWDAMDDVLRALAACHAAGIVHGDVKPGNVLLAQDGSMKLADFGVARPAAGATFVPGAGTLRYMSPEQVRGERPDARSDVYAAAVVFYELLTGRWILPDEDLHAVPQAILARAPTLDLPPASEAARELLACALAKDPAARFADARAMLAAFESARAASRRSA